MGKVSATYWVSAKCSTLGITPCPTRFAHCTSDSAPCRIITDIGKDQIHAGSPESWQHQSSKPNLSFSLTPWLCVAVLKCSHVTPFFQQVFCATRLTSTPESLQYLPPWTGDRGVYGLLMFKMFHEIVNS